MYSKLFAFFLTLAVLLPSTLSAQNYQSTPDVVSACRGYYEQNGASVVNAELNTSQLTSWPSGYTCVQYIHFPAGYAKATLSACSGSVFSSGTLALTITSAATGANIYSGNISLKKSSSEADATAFTGVNFPSAGWYKFTLSNTGSRFGSMSNWKFYKENGTAAYLANSLSSPSTHIWYSAASAPSSNCDWLYQEVMIPSGHDFVGTYAMCIGQANMYMGIQVNSGRRDVIFSVWDNGDTDSDPNLPDYKKSNTFDSGEGVTIGRFGNEGTGTKAFKQGTLWAPGQFVQFICNATPYSQKVLNENGATITYNSMLISAWYRLEGESEWQYLATHRMAGSTKNFSPSAFYSFLENYVSANGQTLRKAYYRNCYAHSASNNTWYHLNRASYTHTDGGSSAGARNDYGQGVANEYAGCFYMTSGGYGATVQGATSMALNTDNSVVNNINLDNLKARVQQAINKALGIEYSMELGGAELIDPASWTVTAWSDQETSGEGTNGRAAQALDGDEDSYWHSQWDASVVDFPHYVVVKAPEDYDLNALEFYTKRYSYGTNNVSYNPRAVTVETSADGYSWTTACSNVSMANVLRPQAVLPATATGRYFRFTFNEGYGDHLFINEIHLYGEPASGSGGGGTGGGGTGGGSTETGELTKISSLSDLNNGTAYVLHNPYGLGRLIYKPAQSATSIWLGDATKVANEGETMYSSDYAAAVDVTQPNNNWFIFHVEGQYYLCNAGAQKYAVTGRPCSLTATPTPINITPVTNGFAFNTTTQDDYFLCASPQLSTPVNIWTSSDAGSTWQIFENPSVEADATKLLEELTGTTDINAVQQNSEERLDIYDLQGRRLNALPRCGIYIVNGRKVIK